MIFKIKRQDIREWHRHFVWFPIQIEEEEKNGLIVFKYIWFQFVWRRCIGSNEDWSPKWEYSSKLK